MEDEAAESKACLNEADLQSMLKLSRVSRRTFAAQMKYQRLRTEELQLITSIMEDEAADLLANALPKLQSISLNACSSFLASVAGLSLHR
ncbi:hypothetical protein AZE42_00474 [Rhizopogon vesiculosus]|uniref:Uncharacterized protein n=1 Tax=Rhizopogon vesiculosus TaxID=180088 RepID=A0A1J8QWE2_9AGAM|nr:hypothetical protein AZE42_00474 [Rhizopogon vesiculosus]